MPFHRVQFTIRRLMAVTVIIALVSASTRYSGDTWEPILGAAILLTISLALLGIAVLTARHVRGRGPTRAPSTEFLCALIGMFFGCWAIPARVNRQPSYFDFLSDMIGIIGGAAIGALVGMCIARADRHIDGMRRGNS